MNKKSDRRSYRLTEQQAKLARAYAQHGVAERAALEAGYSATTARRVIQRTMGLPQVKAEIERLQKEAADKAVVSASQVLEELKLIGFADLVDFVEWGHDPNDPKAPQVRLKPSAALDAARRRAIVEVSETRFGVRIKLADKLGALDRLGKTLGMFVDKVEHSGEIKNAAPVVNLTLTTTAATKEKGGTDG